MTGPVFDFQGDLHQQGGAIIAGPGKRSLLRRCRDRPLSLHHVKSQFHPPPAGPQVHFCHFDTNRLDHMPINWLLDLAGVPQTLDFSKPKIIHM